MSKLVIKEYPLQMPSLRGTVNCTGCGRLIGRGEGQSFYRFEDDKPVGPAMCYDCAQRAQVVDKMEEIGAENESLRAAGAVLLRHIYDSGIAYDNPEVEASLAVFAEPAPNKEKPDDA